MGSQKVNQSFTENYDFIRNIAELAALEVNGRSEFKTEVQFDNTFSGSLNKYLFEKTAFVRIPYVAKYGVDMQNARVITQMADTMLTVHLTPAKLLSLELKVNQVQTMNQNGLFVSHEVDDYRRMEKKLYEQSRSQLSNNKKHIGAAEAQITRIIQNYYKPTGYHVKVLFDLEQATPKNTTQTN
ncbi:MAG: DUF4230 domain-containing protein [Bacteroidia bacterium]|nr:DUF4230 domain-containing protein [Bacteroidia bacterium]